MPADDAKFFADARLREVYAYWRRQRGTKAAPRRADLDPLDLVRVLPIINLLDVLHDPPGFRHRLVGTELIHWMGRDVTGKRVDAAIYGAAAAEIVATLSRVVAEVRPYRRLVRLDWFERNWLAAEVAELPLIDDAGRVTMLLRASHFFKAVDFDRARLEFTPLPP